MNRRERWRKVLDLEVARWSAKSFVQVETDLREPPVYEVEMEGVAYQVEVDLLHRSEDSIEIMVSVDDGSLPASIFPAACTVLCKKGVSPPGPGGETPG